ncbi:MAG: type I 3-dehydroquinate dehydratase [Betaproteobacteria bacterium]|nr:type I 3-dehydroquinate dehydratase [Betaproteobacteria bacterium]
MTTPAKPLDLRGRLLGGARPLVCSPLVGRTRERLLAETAAVLAKRPDVIEWRVDYYEAIADTAAVLETGRAMRGLVGDTPIIFTRRSIREGGEPIPIGDAGVVALYGAVAASRLVDLIDFEMGNDPDQIREVRASTRAAGTRLILSYHNFGYTPGAEFLVQRFLEAERLGADVAKVAVMPRDRADVLALLSATAQADAKSRIPLISMSMGPLGTVTRMVGGVFGSSLSFAIGEGASAPGQMPIADLVSVFGALARARGES